MHAGSGLGLVFGLGKDGFKKGLRPIYTTQRLPKTVACNQMQPTYNLNSVNQTYVIVGELKAGCMRQF